MPGSKGSVIPEKNASKAAKPPAEAPIPTTGKLGTGKLGTGKLGTGKLGTGKSAAKLESMGSLTIYGLHFLQKSPRSVGFGDCIAAC
jgi:hypothetical protein